MKPLNEPAARLNLPSSHPEARSVPPATNTVTSSAWPSPEPDASSLEATAARSAASSAATTLKPEPKIESRPDPSRALALPREAKPERITVAISEPRTEPRPEPMRESARDLTHLLYCERRPETRSEPGPGQLRERAKEPRQEPRQQARPGTPQDPSPQHRKEPPQQRPEPPALPMRELEDPKQRHGDGWRPVGPDLREADRSPLPAEKWQDMAAKPPDPSPKPMPGSKLPPDPPFRPGPKPLHLTEPPPTLALDGEGAMLPLPFLLSGILPAPGQLPDAARFYLALRDAMDNTLLMQASQAGHAELVAFLLEAGSLAYARALNIFGRNAAMIARDNGHSAVLALLQQAGVELQPDNPALQWYLQNRGDLVMSARVQDWQPLAALLAQDHFMNLRDANGRTLLFHAVMNADLDAVRFLCGCLDSPFVGWKDVYGNSVFRYTTRIPNVETGTAVCQELRSYRRRTRWKHKRRPWARDEEGRELVWGEPVWRATSIRNQER